MSSNDCLSSVAVKNNVHKCPNLEHSLDLAIWALEMELYMSRIFCFKETFFFPSLYLPTSPHTSNSPYCQCQCFFFTHTGKGGCRDKFLVKMTMVAAFLGDIFHSGK